MPLSIPRRVLLAIGVAAVAILALRSAIGPFLLPGFHVPVNSPFAAENAFWLAFLGLLCLDSESGVTHKSADNRGIRFPSLQLALALGVIALAFVHNLSDPFLSDDYIIVSAPPFSTGAFLASLHTPGGDGAFRPLGTLYFQILHAFAGVNPLRWHLVPLGLHLVNSALVFVIAWKFWRDTTAAIMSALAFGLHGTNPEVVVWTASNRDLPACACVLGGILLALPQREQGRRLRLFVSLLLVAVGVLCKESAYAGPLVAFWMLRALPGPLRRFRAYLAGSCLVCAALVVWRWQIFHGPGGYVDRATGQPSILSLHLVASAKAIFLRIWAVMLAPVNWDASRAWWLPLAIVASTAALLLLAAGNRPETGVSRRTHLFLIAAACCAVLPAIHLALIGQSALGSRVLYLAGAPFALLIGSLTVAAGKRNMIVTAVVLAGIAGILEHNLAAWRNGALLARSLCREAARRPPGEPDIAPPGTVDGVYIFQNGFRECVAAARNGK